MNQVDIYYFSGTGNARHVAESVAKTAIQNGVNASLHNIGKNPVPVVSGKRNTLLFVSPTHGFNFPPVVIKFILGLPRTNNKTPVYLSNTRAGMKLGRIYFPGLSGIALLLSAFILMLKGYVIKGMRPFDLPSNWISLHPGLTGKAVSDIFRKRKSEINHFAKKIVQGKKDFRALYDFPQDLLISPVALGYYFAGRFLFAKSFYASSLCDNCGVCIKGCPVGAITEIESRPFWKSACESCMKCMNNCPRRAIETGHSFILFVLWLFYSVLLPVFYTLPVIKSIAPVQNNSFLYYITGVALNTFLFLFFLFFVYRVFHYMLGYPVFRKFVFYTSLTRLRFWRRYKAPVK